MTLVPALVVTLMLAGLQEPAPAPASTQPGAAARYADNACIQCHRNLAGRSAEIVDLEWVRSVHCAAGVACEGCHGGDASVKIEQYPSAEAAKRAAHLAMNPEFLLLRGREDQFVSRARGRSISYFCGRCHTEIMEKHLGSPHGNFGDPSCIFCHGQGSHAILPPTLDIIDTRPRSEGGRCSPCHQAGTMKVVAEIKEILGKTAERIDSSAARFAELEKMGYRNLALGEMHHHTAETHSRLRRVFHSFNLREINDLAASIESVSKRTDYAYKLVHALHRARRDQTLVGLGAVLFLLAFAAVLLYYKHAYCEHYDRSTAVPGSARRASPGADDTDRDRKTGH